MKAKKKIEVVVVDDEESVIDGLARYFAYSDNIELVGTAMSGRECLGLMERKSTDVIIMDVKMESKKAGIIAAEQILEKEFGVPKIIFLSAYYKKRDIDKAIEMGCSFVDKSCSVPRLIEIIKEVFYEDKIIIEP